MKTTLPKYIEYKYEQDFGEPWSELEKRVRARHPITFAMLDAYEQDKAILTKKWWQIWK